MSNRFPAPCPVSKMIQGSKSWCGFPGFNFPGFVGTYDTSGGGWGGSPPTPVPGDLVLEKIAGFTSDSVTFPACYFVYLCILAGATASGRSVNPQVDGTYFQAWNFLHGSAIPVGPTSPWPIDDGFSSLREVWSLGTTEPVAYLNMTQTTTLASFPAAAVPPPSSDPTRPADTFSGHYLNAGNGTFEEDWLVNRWTGGVTYTPPGTAWSADQGVFIFPAVPLGYAYEFNPPDDAVPSAVALKVSTAPAALVSWSFTGTSLTFVWAAWPQNGCGSVVINAGFYSAAATVTQVFAVDTEYDFSTDQSDALALLSGTTFAALNWNQLATCSYNADGSIAVVKTTMGSTTAVTVGCSGATAPAASGYAFAEESAGLSWSYGKALVDVCGNYCQRTYYCDRATPVVDCSSGTVDGYAPVEIGPPSYDPTLGDTKVATYIFPNCVCT